MPDDFSFAPSVAEAATKFLNDTPAPETPDTPAEEQVETPDLGADVPNREEATPAQTPQATEAKSDTLIEVTLPDGTTQKLPVDELKKGYMRQADYTRKRQAEAQAQQQFQQQVQLVLQEAARRQQMMEQFLSDRAALERYIQQQFPNQPQQPEFDPTEIATVEQAQQVAQRQLADFQEQLAVHLQQMQQAFDQKVQTATQELEDRRETAAYATVINQHLAKIFQENPLLEAVDNIEDLLRWQVYQTKPQTIEQTLEAFSHAAKQQAEKLNARFNEVTKKQVVQKQKLLQNNIEPPGGSGVQPQPSSYKKSDGSIDWNKLAASATAYLNSNPK